MPLDLNQLRDLLTALNQTDIAELTLKSDDFELTVRRGLLVQETMPSVVLPSRAVGLADSGDAAGAAPSLASAGATSTPSAEPMRSESPTPAGTVPPPSNHRRTVEIISPMVGTFYRAPAPDEPPFVDVGDRIRVGQVVCIIEAMKLMNELEAEMTGEIVEILVQNGQPVEYGQPLMRVNPA